MSEGRKWGVTVFILGLVILLILWASNSVEGQELKYVSEGDTLIVDQSYFLLTREQADSMTVKLMRLKGIDIEVELWESRYNLSVSRYEIQDSLNLILQKQITSYKLYLQDQAQLHKLSKRHWYDVTTVGFTLGIAVSVAAMWATNSVRP